MNRLWLFVKTIVLSGLMILLLFAIKTVAPAIAVVFVALGIGVLTGGPLVTDVVKGGVARFLVFSIPFAAYVFVWYWTGQLGIPDWTQGRESFALCVGWWLGAGGAIGTRILLAAA